MQILEVGKGIHSEQLRKALDSLIEVVILQILWLCTVSIVEGTQLLKKLLRYVRVQRHHVHKPGHGEGVTVSASNEEIHQRVTEILVCQLLPFLVHVPELGEQVALALLGI